MSKRRVSLRLADDEIAVVGPLERWQHLIMIYELFAADPAYAGNKVEWKNSAEWVRSWIAKAESAGEDW